MGVDVQRGHLTFCAADLRYISQHDFAVQVPHPATITDTLINALDSLRLSAPYGPLRNVVVAVPAPSDGHSLQEPNVIPELDVQSITRWSDTHGIPLRFENDANLAAIAEYQTGAARGADPFAVLLERETGIGLGLFFCGALYRGQRGRAGELGEVRWPSAPGGPDTLLETLAATERYDALSYLLAGLAATLDLNLVVLSLQENETLADHVRQILASAVTVVSAKHGDDGPVRGALLMAVEQARHILFSTPAEVLS